MSMNHHVAVPAPRPICAIYKPQLALLVFDLLDADQAAELRSHLADCEYCQLHLREYEIVRGVLQRHVGLGPLASGDGAASAAASAAPVATSHATRQPSLATEAPPHFTLEDIMQAANKPPTPTQTTDHLSPVHDLSPRRRAITALGAIAAVLVLTVLAASLFSYFGSHGVEPGVKPTPTRGLDAQSQAYYAVLDTYFRPVSNHLTVAITCGLNIGSHPTRAQDCQSAETVALTDMKTFADHLTVAPPARWQTDDSQLKQASQTAIPLWAAFTASQSASDWDQRKGPADEAVHLYCDPIIHINSDLIAAGLPLSDQLGCTM